MRLSSISVSALALFLGSVYAQPPVVAPFLPAAVVNPGTSTTRTTTGTTGRSSSATSIPSSVVTVPSGTSTETVPPPHTTTTTRFGNDTITDTKTQTQTETQTETQTGTRTSTITPTVFPGAANPMDISYKIGSAAIAGVFGMLLLA